MGQANLLSQADYTTYNTAWVDIINAGDPHVLEALFEQDTRLLTATLPTDQLLQLVSAVGVRYIKVGFVVLPEAPKNGSAFTLALYAANAESGQLTACYLADTLWATGAASGTPPAPVPGCAMAVPPKLADLWQQQWTAAQSVEAKFFKVPGGVLRGYSFEVADFVQALLAVTQPDDTHLRLDFGLHQFYGPDSPGVPDPTRTFGLTIFLADSDEKIVSAQYDMAMPRPPAP